MEKQEIFDKALTHLREQGHRAVNHFGSCRYRTSGGSKCAIGALIPDSKYSSGLEGKVATHDKVLEAAGIPLALVHLAFAVQNDLHDLLVGPDFLKQLEKSAQLLAEKYGLKYEQPPTE